MRTAGSLRRADPELELDDKQLTLAFQRGDSAAYSDIYERHAPKVQRLCRRMLGNPDDAAEASQETFLRVYQSLGHFNGRYQLGAWIMRIATNVCLDQLRARARKPGELGVDLLETEADLCREDDDPSFVSIRLWESRRVARLLSAMPPMHRAAIVLRDFEGFTYAEIASVLDITDSQVKALLHRARAGFKRAWRAQGIAAFLPLRLWSRIRTPSAVLDERAPGAAAQTSQFLVNCGTALQQCGQMVADKAGPAFAALLVAGSAAVSIPSAAAPAIDPPAEKTVATPTAARESAAHRGERPRATEEAATAEPPIAPAIEEPEPAAPPAEGAEPSPSPEPTSSPTSPPEETDPPAPLVASLGFDRGSEIPPSEVFTNDATVDCDAFSVSQRLETVVHDGDDALPATLVLDTGSSASVELTVERDGAVVHYTGGGPLVERARSGTRLNLQFSGSFASGGSAAANAQLPASGRFGLTLMLDCSSHSVVTESLVFNS